MKSCLCCWRQTLSEIQKWIFDIWPYISVTPSLAHTQPRCSPLNCPPYVRRGQAYPPLLSPFFFFFFEHVSGIFRSFAREDAGSVASGFWRWLVSVSSITGASFKLMHNRAPQSTSSSLSPRVRNVQGAESQQGKKKTPQQSKGRLTEESRLHPSLLSYLHMRRYGFVLCNRTTMEGGSRADSSRR